MFPKWMHKCNNISFVNEDYMKKARIRYSRQVII